MFRLMVEYITESRSMNEILSEIGKTKKSILIGNGFNQAMPNFGERFKWSNLRNFVENTLSATEKVILDQHKGQFESALERLSTTLETLELLPDPTDDTTHLINKLKKLRRSIRQNFFRAVLQAHPQKKDFPGPDAVQFIWVDKNFDYIFTLNYDLLLYWAVLGDTGKFYDGFGLESGIILWGRNKEAQRYFHIHGNLNYGLIEHGNTRRIKKHSHAEINEIEAFIDADLCQVVSECTATKKNARLDKTKSAYLSHCADKLAAVPGVLFTYGASFDNDEHLLFIIFSRSIQFEAVYFGVYDLANTGLMERLKGKILDLCKTNDIKLENLPNIYFFETSGTRFEI